MSSSAEPVSVGGKQLHTPAEVLLSSRAPRIKFDASLGAIHNCDYHGVILPLFSLNIWSSPSSITKPLLILWNYIFLFSVFVCTFTLPSLKKPALPLISPRLSGSVSHLNARSSLESAPATRAVSSPRRVRTLTLFLWSCHPQDTVSFLVLLTSCPFPFPSFLRLPIDLQL